MLCWCIEDGQDKEDSKFHSTLLRAGLRINKSVCVHCRGKYSLSNY